MDNYSSDEEELEMKNFHCSVNSFNRKNPLSLEDDNRNYRKRSSSLSLNLPKNFVPKLKPIETIICPSPIDLNDNSPPPISDNNEQFLTSSIETKKIFNIKPIKFNQPKKRNLKKSSKIMSVEEETHETEAISDCEDKPKKAKLVDYDLDSSDNEIQDNENFNCNKKKDTPKNININVIREKMMIIRKNSIKNEYDDSNIRNNYTSKKLNQRKSIYQQKCTEEARKNKNLSEKNLNSIKNRTRSFNIRQRYVSTILGFLEQNNSKISLNSNGK